MKTNRYQPLVASILGISVTAVLFASAHRAAAQSISVNFGSEQGGSTISEAGKTTGALPVAGDRWNNTTGVNSSLGGLIDSTGAATGASVAWTANNTWYSDSTGATATSENGDLTKGYLDDGGGWTVNMTVPYLVSNIYVIHATDQGNPATLSAVSVNGTFYKGNGAGGTVLASGVGDSWSAGNWTNADSLVQSTNYLRIDNQAAVSLAAFNSSPGRAAIAGVQVENAYAGTLSFWDIDDSAPGAGGIAPSGTWSSSDTFWSTSAAGDVGTGFWNPGDAAVFSAGTDATGSYTVTVDGTQTADAVWVQDGSVTLSGGTLNLTGTSLLRADGSLTVDSAITASSLTTAGTVTINAATSLAGSLTVQAGTTTLGASVSAGSLGGAGTLAIGGASTLTVGSANTSGTFGGILSGTGGFVKTGTGTLTLGGGGTSTFGGAITVNNGALTLGKQSALGQTSGITVASGGKVNLNGQTAGNLATGGYSWTIAGDGGDGLGAITNTGADIYASSGVKSLTLSADAKIGGNNGRFDVGRHEGTGTYGTINGATFTLTKVGSSAMVFRAPATDITYVVDGGSLTFEDYDTASGTNPITVNAGTLATYGGRTIANDLSFAAGTALGNNGGGSGTWTGPITLTGAAATTWTINAGEQINIAGSITGDSDMIVGSSYYWTVLENTANTGFTGKVDVNGGNLRIAADGSLGPVPGVAVADAIILRDDGFLQGGTRNSGADVTIHANRGISISSGAGWISPWGGYTLTIDGEITGNTLNKVDGGAAVFNGNINLNGNLMGYGGTMTIGAGLTLTNATNGYLRTQDGTSLVFGGAANADVRRMQLGTTTVSITPGATVTTGGLITSDGGGNVSVVNQTGGTFNVTGTDNSNSTSASFLMGHWGYGSSSNYNLSGGTLNAAGAELSLGWDSGNVHFNQSGGTANFRGIDLNNGRGNGNTDYNMTGGRLNLGDYGITNQANKAINLGGGTVGAFADWSSSKNITLTGTNGDVSFDTVDSNDLTTPRTITLSGVLSGTGGLIKKGAGTLALTNAAGTFTGTASSEGGTLLVGSGSAAAATVKSVAGGTVQPGLVATAGTANVANLTLDGGSAAFRVGTSSDKFNVTGTLTIEQPTVISALPANAITSLPATFTVIDYTGTIGGPIGFDDLSFVPANPHLSGELIHVDGDRIDVQINTADTITWTGADDGVWDVGTVTPTTANWRLDSDDTTPSEYYSFDVVTFDEAGIGQPNVSLVGTITPASVTVANVTGTYTLSGSGISGTGSLTKTSTGDLTLLNTNTYAGTTTITGGTVTVGDGTTTGTLGGAGTITLSGATLVMNRSDAQSLARTIGGTGGTLIKNGAGTLTMTGPNNTCDIIINNGVVAARSGDWSTSFAGGKTITVNAGGTLDTTTHSLGGLGGATFPAGIVLNEDGIWKLNNEQYIPTVTMTAGVINGPGEIRGGGTINVNAHATKSSSINSPVNQVGTITYNVADGAVATDLAVTGSIYNGGALTKLGAGTMVLTGTNNTYSGGTNANGGVLEVSSVADAGGAGSIGTNYLGIANDGTFRYTGTGAQTTARNLWIDTGVQTKTIEITSPTGDLTFSGTAGNINKPFIKSGAGALTIADEIVAGSAVTVNGGKLTLGGTNSYTGDTVVNAGGTLVVDGDAIADAGRLDVNGSGKVEVTEPVDPTQETVDTLWIDGVQMAAGTYGATGSGATNVDDTHFAGAGVINVTTGPVVPSGYNTWAATNAPGIGQTPATDFDGDGVPNGVEYVLGGDKDTNDLGKLPVPATDGTNMTFTFVRDQDSVGPDTSVEIEVGTDLITWPASYTVGADTAGSDPEVTVTDNLDGTDTITLTVTMAPDAVKFARLNVVITTP